MKPEEYCISLMISPIVAGYPVDACHFAEINDTVLSEPIRTIFRVLIVLKANGILFLAHLM